MDTDFNDCTETWRLVSFKVDMAIINKELQSAAYDLERARKNVIDEDFKWATVQAYYSVFHSAKALIYAKGYKEKSHKCLFIALKTLYVDNNKIEISLFIKAKNTMNLREDADYGFIYSKNSASGAISIAYEFLSKAKELLGKND